MVRKTRKHSTKKTTGAYSIPELRRSFEHIEEFVDNKIADHESKEKIIKDVRREWSKVFLKELDRKSADAFVSERMSRKPLRRRTARVYGGAGAQLPNTQTPIAGAPNDYTTRAGIYLAPGQIPDNAGHLPRSDGAPSNFGSFVEYVSKGFWNPEPGQSYDPVPGQTRFPTSVPAGMGSNAVHFAAKGGGKRRTRRRGQRAGGAGALIQQAFTHPFSAAAPAGVLQDMQDKWYGKSVGPSPDQIQRSADYKLGSVYPRAISY
jgi:hypothetical protein